MHFQSFQGTCLSFCFTVPVLTLFCVAMLGCTVDTQRQSAIVFVINGKLSRSCIKLISFNLLSFHMHAVCKEKWYVAALVICQYSVPPREALRVEVLPFIRRIKFVGRCIWWRTCHDHAIYFWDPWVKHTLITSEAGIGVEESIKY